VARVQLRRRDHHQRAARQGDTFTSIHIEEFETQVRDTKAGMEEITREIRT